MNKRARTSTLPEVNVRLTTTQDSCSVTTSDIWLSRYLALPIPGSRLNARNAPGARPYCNRQLLKKIHGFNTMKIYYAIHFLRENFLIYGMTLISGTLLTKNTHTHTSICTCTYTHTYMYIHTADVNIYKVHGPPSNVEWTTFSVVTDLLTRDCMNSQQLGLCFDVFLVEVGLGLHEAHHLQCVHV